MAAKCQLSNTTTAAAAAAAVQSARVGLGVLKSLTAVSLDLIFDVCVLFARNLVVKCVQPTRRVARGAWRSIDDFPLPASCPKVQSSRYSIYIFVGVPGTWYLLVVFFFSLFFRIFSTPENARRSMSNLSGCQTWKLVGGPVGL